MLWVRIPPPALRQLPDAEYRADERGNKPTRASGMKIESRVERASHSPSSFFAARGPMPTWCSLA